MLLLIPSMLVVELYDAVHGTAVPAGNLFNPLLLMLFINCGVGCLLIVLDRPTFVAMPRGVSPDAMSLPSQIPGRKSCPQFW